MKRLLLFVIFLTLTYCLKVNAQTARIQGVVVRESNNAAVHLASVVCVNTKDSLLITASRSDVNGHFMCTVPSNSSVKMYIHFPGSLSYSDTITISGDKTMDTVYLIDVFQSLQAAVIKGYTDGIKINGDTTEYFADFFKTNPGATVEDLLKKLPGIQVNRNGEITAQGKKVDKILVDGEEFFSDDPGIATKYLQASMIDKVQVYDENKDTMSGTTGDEKRTLNLTMKEGQNKGVFGKVEAGSNFKEYSNAGAFVGYFNPKIKAAAYSKTSNFENSSLNWDERGQYGGSAAGGSFSEDGMNFYYMEDNNFGDQLDSRGIPSNTSGGGVLNFKFNKKISYNASYRYANESLNGQVIKNSEYLLPDTSYTIRDTSSNSYNQVGQRLSMKLDLNPDSLNRITISLSAGKNSGESLTSAMSETTTARKINDNGRTLSKNYEKENVTVETKWTKNFARKGRTLEFNSQVNLKPGKTEQGLQASTNFYKTDGNILFQNITNQVAEINNTGTGFSGNLRFVEPLGKKYTLRLGYNFNFNTSGNATSTFNKASAGELIDSLSNAFAFDNQSNKLNLTLNYKHKKITAWGTLGGGYTQYSQLNKSSNTKNGTEIINFLPNLGINYAWKKQSSIQLSYSGSNNAPSIQAIQPVINNNDLLNRVVGNPNLEQAFNHNIAGNINSFKTLKGRYIWGYFNFSLPRNAFVSDIFIDSSGVRRTRTVNSNGNYYFNSSLDYTIKLKKLPIYISAGGSYSTSNVNSYNNGVKISTLSHNPSGNTTISLELDFLELDFSYEYSYNFNESNVGSNQRVSYVTHTPSGELTLNLPGKFSINATADFNIRPASKSFPDPRNVFFMSSYIAKKFTKKNQLEMSLYFYDILNQNLGFNRYISTNFITEEVYTVLSRYWLLKLRWNFTSTGKGDSE